MAAVVWSPDTRLLETASPGAWEVNAGPFRAAVAGHQIGRPTAVVWHPTGARVTYQFSKASWLLQDYATTRDLLPDDPLAPPSGVTRKTAAVDPELPDEDTLWAFGAYGAGISDEWRATGDGLKHVVTIPTGLEIPDDAAALVLEGVLLLADCDTATLRGGTRTRTAGSLALFHPSQPDPVMVLQRGYAEDDAGNRTHVLMEWHNLGRGKVALNLRIDADWLRDAVGEVRIDPTIMTTSNAGATTAPNQHKLDRFSNGVLLAVIFDGSNSIARISSDNGQTWTTPASGATIGAYSEPAVAIDTSDFAHVVCRTNPGQLRGNVTYLRGTPSSGNTSITWSAAFTVETSGLSALPDLVVHAEGTGWKVHIAYSQVDSSGPVCGANYARLNVTSPGVVSLDTNINLGSRSGSADTFPAIAIDGNKNVFVMWEYGSDTQGVKAVKISYSAGSWTTGGVETAFSNYCYSGANCAGSLVTDSAGRVFGGFRANSLGAGKVVMRAVAGGWSDITPANFNPFYVCLASDTAGNVYLIYCASGVKYRVYNGSTWGSEITLDSDATAAFTTVRRNLAGSALDIMYMVGSANPYTVKTVRVSFNQAPTAPDGLAPDNGAGFDATAAITLSATAHDPDSGDFPVQALWEIAENVAGSTTYYVKADGTLTTVPTWVATGGGTFNLSRQIAAGKLANGKTWKWRVTTQDGSGVQSPASAYAIFKTSAAPTATITSPAAGATIAATPLTVQCSVADPEGKPLGTVTYRLYADNAGVKGALIEQVSVASLVKTMATNLTLYNGVYVWIEVQATDGDGVTGPAVAQRYAVSLTPPLAPTVQATARPNASPPRIDIAVTNPAPGSGVPDAASNRIERSADGGFTWVSVGTVAKNGTLQDLTPASGVTYQYRAVAITGNGIERAGSAVAAAVNFDAWWFVPDSGLAVTFRYNARAPWQIDEDVTVPKTQGQYQQVFAGPAFAEVRQIEATLAGDGVMTARQWRNVLKDHIQQRRSGYLRSPTGDVLYGTMLALQGETNASFGLEIVRFTFRETRGVS